jgi:hypothetical protein
MLIIVPKRETKVVVQEKKYDEINGKNDKNICKNKQVQHNKTIVDGNPLL